MSDVVHGIVPKLALALLLAYLALPEAVRTFGPPPIAYRNTPFPVLTPVIKPGDTVAITVARCASDPFSDRTEMPFTFTRAIVRDDGIQIPVMGGYSSMPMGCNEIVSRLSVIPMDLPPGTYRLQGISTATNSWGRVALANWETQPFRVEARANDLNRYQNQRT